jgi:putative DNA primase/helicase
MVAPRIERENWIAKAKAVRIEDELARRNLLKTMTRQGQELVGPCPKCSGTDRFGVNLPKQLWNCRQCGGKGGDAIGLAMHLDGSDFLFACETVTGEPPPKANGKAGSITVKEYVYRDENGKPEIVAVRLEDGTIKDGKRKKTFRQKRPDPARAGKWINNVAGCRVLPYKLPELIEAIANERPILIVEGEGKVDLLAEWGVAATCNAGGAKKWKPEHAAFLKDADVVLVPDNDGVGWEHINLVGASLIGIAKRNRVLVLPGLGPKGDIIDWARSGGTREQLDELIAKAPDWQAPAVKTDEQKADAERSEKELLDALAKMPKGLEAARERKRLAKEFHVSRSDIDAEIEARRAQAESAAPLHGHWYVEPWPEPADGDALIRDIIRKLQKHVVISHDYALGIAIWTMLAWVHDEVATHSPILAITSAEPESGKTTLLGVLSFLLPRAIASVDISRAALYRAIQQWQPSFVIDEFDDVLAANNNTDKAELRSVINSGHTKGTGVIRCITDEHKPELFPTFCPKAIGMVGNKMPATTLGRCIVIELRRRKKIEPITRFKHADDTELGDLRSRLRRWSMDNTEALRGCAPAMPDAFENRRADNWRVQFAIADLAGEDWGDKARAAALKIEGGSDSRTDSGRVLADIKPVFYPKNEKGSDLDPLDRMSSADLVARLCADNDSPWAEWKRGKPITPVQLARLLKPFRIAPEVIRLPSGGTSRGYLRTQFEDVWDRYL